MNSFWNSIVINIETIDIDTMGFHKRQKQKQTKEKQKGYVPEDYEHYKKFCREQNEIKEKLKKQNINIESLNYIGGFGQYIPKSYMDMMFRNQEQSEQNKKNFGTECIIERINDTNRTTEENSRIVSRAEAMP
jgi:hypothetical protein